MSWRALIVALVLVALAAAIFALSYVASKWSAVPESTLRRILIVRNPPALDAVADNFVGRLVEMGYVGDKVSYTNINVGGDVPSTVARIRAEMEAGRPDAVVVLGVLAARAAKEVMEAGADPLPVVFGVVSDPVGVGLIRDMQSSGNYMTGVTPANQITAPKRLEYLKELLPGTKRVIHVWSDEQTSGVVGLRKAAGGLGLVLVDKKFASAAEVVAFLRDFDYEPGDAILRSSDSVGASALASTIQVAKDNKVPLVGTNAGDTQRGALMSYGADYEEIGRALARIADLVLRGTAPSAIPIEEASRFDISVNLGTADAIGARIPQTFLLKTDVVIRPE
jgi:putative tryptophan/tyrosine transport system substrate-binding protein